MFTDLYTGNEYLEKNPTWHLGESPWKAAQILRMLCLHNLTPHTICEVGCGAGEILRLLQERMANDCMFWGYEISPHAFALCQGRQNERLHFKLADIQQEPDASYDLILLMDVLEHMEDYFTLLRDIHSKSRYKIFHFPLDLSVRSLMRGHLVEYRQQFGHIHYFTKELALRLLQDLNYTVLDCFYTSEPVLVPPDDPAAHRLDLLQAHLRNSIWQLRKVPSKLCFALDQDLAAHVFGDWRLLVLAE